jgi:serine/threonine protein kinase
MSADDVLSLGIALAEALDVLHTRQLLHRDIKPSNIGFDQAGVPKLLDFGLAQLLSTSTRLPADLRPDMPAAGTPLYMSPEAVSGAVPTHAFDLWSMHVLLYEAIAGRHPFRRDTTEGTLRAITDASAPPLTVAGTLTPDRTARLVSYFAGALSRNTVERPGSAAEASTALRSLMA